MNENRLREEIVKHGKSLYDRGFTHGGTGNISARLEDGWLLTPTGSFLGDLDPDKLSKLDSSGNHIGGDKPTKEFLLHHAMYQERPNSGAIVHLHPPSCVAVSMLSGLDPDNIIPPITPYYVMRIGALPLVPYIPPGAPELAEAVKDLSQKHHAIMLAHHGPVVAGVDVKSAVDAIEELEATARLFLTLSHKEYKVLTTDQVQDLERRFPIKA